MYENKLNADANLIDDVHDNIIPESYDIRRFCLLVLSSIKDKLEEREYKILYDALSNVPKALIAVKWHLSKERIRQIVNNVTKQSMHILAVQRERLKETENENSRLRVQIDLLNEKIERLKEMLPDEVDFQDNDNKIDTEISNLLETPIEDIKFPVRICNKLGAIDIIEYGEILQFPSIDDLLKVSGIGRKSAYDISIMLADFNLSLGMSLNEAVKVLNNKDWYDARKKWIKGYDDEKKSNKPKKKGRAASVGGKKNTPIKSSPVLILEMEDSPSPTPSPSPVEAPIQDNSTGESNDMEWTENQEKSLSYFFRRIKDYGTLSKFFGRSEQSIKLCLARLGL